MKKPFNINDKFEVMDLSLWNLFIRLTKRNIELSKYLLKSGFLINYFLDVPRKQIMLCFHYYYNNIPITCMEKMNTKFYPWQYFCLLDSKYYIWIVSTRKGLLTGKEVISKKVGGQIVMFISILPYK